MSRVGLRPIEVPSGVTVKFDGPSVTVKGSKGELERNFNERIPLKSIPGSITVQLRRSPSNVTERELGAAYLEASDLLQDRA